MKNERCCFTGHRPSKLYGYSLEDKRYQILAKLLRKVVEQELISNGYSEFITGGALGLDTVAFFVINDLKRTYPNLKNILAIPYEDQFKKWTNPIDLDRYRRMKSLADEIIYVDKVIGYENSKVKEGVYHKDKLDVRNNYMVDTSNFFVSVWDGTYSGTKNCIDYALEKGLCGYNINPKTLEMTNTRKAS